MRLMVMAAERAATMATTIQANWRSVGQPRCVARAASNAPVSAKGSANTECSNLIISRTMRMRLVFFICGAGADASSVATSGLGLFRGRWNGPAPAIHFFLRQADLREDAADILCDEVVDSLRVMIKRGDGGHD